MIDNKTKQYIASLDERILRLETALGGLIEGARRAEYVTFTCRICSAVDPNGSGHVCCEEDCCMGLNPGDDQNVR